MVGRKRSLRPRGTTSANVSQAPKPPASIYDQMLEEAGVGESQSSSITGRPLKRLKPDQKSHHEPEQLFKPSETAPLSATTVPLAYDVDSADSEGDIEFQDVPLPTTNQQVIEIESEDESDEDDVEFENVLNLGEPSQSASSAQSSELELNLSAQREILAPSRNVADRRKPITKEERERRMQVHQLHLLCLLSHVARRNHWCNDARVQASLRKHLGEKTIKYLTPGSHLPQFGQAESLKNGLKQTAEFWKVNYEITERGMKRALWAEELDQLEQYVIPDHLDSCLDREAFREAAEHLQGSRDVGAQLYCALLRSVGVRARLVCSLQPLAFGSGAPTLLKPAPSKASTKTKKNEAVLAQIAKQREAVASENKPPPGTAATLRRLGHPNAAAYNFEPTASPPKNKQVYAQPRRIRESPYPIYWVEVLDKGHQKWQPADPLVTNTFWKPKSLEPPITDRENSLGYVVAFDSDGSAKDITIRYAKAYAAKTRRMRVDGVEGQGSKWWQRVMSLYRRGIPSNLDQIESNELSGLELREPMPRNVQDFKDHPVFALERHLRRHEVLTPSANPSGTVSAGTNGPLEKIYRRKDVRTAKTADKWFRCGREVKPNEIPAKWLPKKIKRKPNRFGDNDLDDNEDLQGGVPIYTEEQTELYEPRPVRLGIVPKNKFGNIEIYVPSMVPRGGAHISHEHARRAAFQAGVDHAPALTGFQFKGRQGTAVFDGVVVPAENEEAVRAIIDGIADLEILMEEERRTLAALKVWRRFMMGLRIRERIWSGVGAEEREAADNEALDADTLAALETDRQAALEAEKQAALDAEMQDVASDVTEEFDMVADDDSDMGGGFLVE